MSGAAVEMGTQVDSPRNKIGIKQDVHAQQCGLPSSSCHLGRISWNYGAAPYRSRISNLLQEQQRGQRKRGGTARNTCVSR